MKATEPAVPFADARRPIGGEMELPLVTLLDRGTFKPRRFNGVLTDSGRSAIRLALRQLAAPRKGRALLPAYLCEAILQPFREEGVRYSFYRTNGDLRIDADDLRRAARRLRPSVVLFINYFGFPVGEDETSVLTELRKECLLIEDCVQGSLLEFARPSVGLLGDYVLTSFRKYTPLPDGALLRVRRNRTSPLPLGASSIWQLRLLGQALRDEQIHVRSPWPTVEEGFLALFDEAERQLKAASPMAPMSDFSRSKLQRVPWRQVADARRTNFQFLHEEFERDSRLNDVGVPVFRSLPERVSPLAFPVRLRGRRDALRRDLRARRVFAPVHWPLPPEVDNKRFAEAHALARAELSLPLDQRYEQEDMKRMLDDLLAAWRRIS